MKIKGARWGHTPGGFACGPVPGDTMVEIAVGDENEKKYFVTEVRWMSYVNLYVSTFPMLEKQSHLHDEGVDVAYESDKLAEESEEFYNFEEGDTTCEALAEMEKSEFYPVIQLVRRATQVLDQWDSTKEQMLALLQPCMHMEISELKIVPEEEQGPTLLRL